MESIQEFLEFDLINIGKYNIRVFTILMALSIILITKLITWLIKKTMYRKLKTNKIDGNTYALYQIIKYLIWVISIALILETIGVKVTVLIAGSAALLVGIGLGLQQTFNDVISGIILLSERSIRVGDILEIDGDIVKIQDIGLRTSKGLNRDEISIIIPNSLITTNKVINWSHQSKQTRFRISVGLVDFGNSSLDFQVLFFSQNIFRIEKVKSEIRRIINRKFAENNITIPFPQMDVHVKANGMRPDFQSTK